MKRTIGIIFVFIIFVAGAMLFTGCGRKTVEQTQPTETTAPATTTPVAEESHAGKAWIQVTKPGVFIIANDNTTTTLSSGDELHEGATIMTDATGLANVVFVDGSVARLDSNTRVTVLSGSYDKGTKTLSARFKLTAGNLWSKIIALATPESYWEVQTSNAIAAVRGTAFGVSYDKETTRIIGSEHTVTVKAVNPKTNEIITDQETTVGEGKYIVITVADIEPLIKKTAKLADWVRVTPKKILDEVWIKRSIEADLKIVNQIKTAESMGLTADQSVQIYLDGLNDEKQAAQAASAAAAATTTLTNTTTVAGDGTAATNDSGATNNSTSDTANSDTSATNAAGGTTASSSATGTTTAATSSAAILRSTLNTTKLRSVITASTSVSSVTAAR